MHPTGPLDRRRHAPLLLALGVLFAACGQAASDSRVADAEPTETREVPLPRTGEWLLGRSLASLRFDPGLEDGDPHIEDDAARATLMRWWTDTCPYCEASLPAFDELRLRFAGEGLNTLAIYHPKPRRAADPGEVIAAARERGYTGTVLLDPDWSRLDRAWPPERRRATSVSLLLDADGVVRYVHPGPELHASTDPEHARCDSDYEDLVRAIEAVLSRSPD